jgi:hypothetical protein
LALPSTSTGSVQDQCKVTRTIAVKLDGNHLLKPVRRTDYKNFTGSGHAPG